MKVIVMVKATKDSEAGVMPSEQLLAEMGRYNEELAKAGIMLSGEGLHPSSKGARVRFSGKGRSVIHGPFTETNELVAGFWMWQVKSLEEAIDWVKRCPNPMMTESEIEIRPVFSAEDFGAEFTPELQAQEERIRTEIESYLLESPRFENGKEMLIAGLGGHYTMENRGTIPALWEKFVPHLSKIPGQTGTTCYGVSYNCDDSCNFDYIAGVEVSGIDKLPKEFKHVKVPAQRYVVFPHTKHVSAIDKTIDAIWSKWLPNSKFEGLDTPSFERYTDEFNAATGMGGMEIWVPIKG